MKVALYARVSSRRQERQGTIASQLDALRSYAKEHKYKVADDYVCCDDGYSGTLLARPQLDRLRDGAQASAFDAILVLSPDRLSRKYAYLILILEEFERFGIPVIFLERIIIMHNFHLNFPGNTSCVSNFNNCVFPVNIGSN